MNVIVTGGAGFIGSNLVDKLIDQSHNVLVIDNFVTGYRRNLNPKATLWRDGGDLLDFFKYPEDMPDKVDIVFHLAALARIEPSFEKPVENYLANSTGTIIALEIARKYCSRLIYAGSSTACSDVFLNPYAFFKWTGEQHCRLYNRVYGLSTTIARFFNVYGPRQKEDGNYASVLGIWSKQYRNKEPLTITGDGEQRRDFTHVDDIVNGLLAISNWFFSTCDIFNLGTGKNYSLNEVAKMFDGAGVKYIPKRPGEAQESLADIQKSIDILDWRPKKCLTEYIAATIKSC